MAAIHENHVDLADPHELEVQAGRLQQKVTMHLDMAEMAKAEMRELRERADRIRRQQGREFYVTVLETPQPRRKRTERPRETVRDIGCELGTFTRQEVVDAGPSYATAVHWLDYWVERGTFKAEVVDGQYVYTFVKPEGAPVNRPKRATPEREVVRQMPVVRRGAAVTGTGGGKVSGSTIVNQLARQVRDQGVTTRKTKHKIVFERNGEEIAHASSTPGASSLKNTVDSLRKAGVNI